MHTTTRILLRLSFAIIGIAVGSYCVHAAYENGTALTQGLPGIMFGVAFGGVVVASWLMMPWAEQLAACRQIKEANIWRAGWVLALVFVLANSIIYSAHYRTEAVEGRGLKIEGYEEAKADKARAIADMETAKKSTRWESTKACTSIRTQPQQEFCDQVAKLKREIERTNAILEKGRPGAKDAGIEHLAWMLNIDAGKTGKAIPGFWAVVLELIASFAMKAAFTDLKTPITTRAVAKRRKRSTKKTKPSEKLQGVILKMDRRSTRHFKVAND